MKNYLGKTKKVKAPLKWQSSADSPPTQLAYVTQPEIDMLVKANIHDSMKGQPNMGPSGILSLNGGTPQDKAYDEAVDKSGNESAIDSYYSSPQGQKESKTSDSAQQIINKVSNWQKDTNQGGQNIKTSQKQQKKHTQDIYDKWKKDGKSVTEDKVVEKKVIPEEVTTFFKGFGNVTQQQSRIINKLRKKGLNDASILMALKQGKFADENLIDLMSGEGLKKLFEGLVSKGSLLEKPEYEHEFLGSAGAANIIKKLQGLPTNEQQAYVDEIIKANPEGFQEMFGEHTTKVNPNEFINTLTSANAGNKNFDRVMDPDSYYALHPPQTTGEMERMLGSGITMTKENTKMIQDARDRVSESQGQGGGIGGLGGGGGALPPVTDPTQPTVPDYVLKQQYMPGFTPDYSGGAEQMQIAGGYWDPITKKWIGSPWGTQGQYQFNQGGIVGTNPLLFKNKGGMVNDGGIKSFKKYGY